MLGANLDASEYHNNPSKGWRSGANERGTLEIVWSCTITVFLCCWTSVCVNIPALNDSWLDRIRDKINLAFIGILGPDFLFVLAAGQRDQARRSVVRFRNAGFDDWTLTHAFFANMGGYVVDLPGSAPFPVNSDQLLYLISKGHLKYPATKKEEINDKSKSDGLARAITILQVLWFTVTSIARVVQGLSLTTMELTTLSFIYMMLATSYCWYHKPMDLGHPIVLRSIIPLESILVEASSEAANPWYRTPLDFAGRKEWFMSILWTYYTQTLRYMRIGFVATRTVNTKPFNRIPSDYFPPFVRFSTEVWGGLVMFPYICIFLTAWRFSFPSEVERTMWHVASVSSVIYGLIGAPLTFYFDHVVLPLQVPVQVRPIRSREMDISSSRVGAWLDIRSNKLVDKLRATVQVLKERQGATIIEMGGGQLDANRQPAPTQIVPQSETTARQSRNRLERIIARLRNNSPDQDPALEIPLKLWILATLLCAMYSISRLYILVEDVIGLRQLPESAFKTVDWANFLPHI